MAYLFTLYQNMNLFVSIIILLAFWSLIWKGFALWRAAQKKSVGWFIVLLFLNTAGILPILYLLFTKNPNKKSKEKEPKVPQKSEKKEVHVENNKTDTIKNTKTTKAKPKAKPSKRKVTKK